MSRDAQLLRAMGMGPECFKRDCPQCKSVDALMGENVRFKMRCYQCGWLGEHSETLASETPIIALGLDLDPSEWTVEHDANFARVVWPWLRENCKETHYKSLSNRCLVALSGLGYAHTALWAIGCPNPGPTMCEAIYNVLCGEGE